MLLKINNLIINTSLIISAHFTPAPDQKEQLNIAFANNVVPENALGTMLLQGDAAVQVWNALGEEAHDITP